MYALSRPASRRPPPHTPAAVLRIHGTDAEYAAIPLDEQGVSHLLSRFHLARTCREGTPVLDRLVLRESAGLLVARRKDLEGTEGCEELLSSLSAHSFGSPVVLADLVDSRPAWRPASASACEMAVWPDALVLSLLQSRSHTFHTEPLRRGDLLSYQCRSEGEEAAVDLVRLLIEESPAHALDVLHRGTRIRGEEKDREWPIVAHLSSLDLLPLLTSEDPAVRTQAIALFHRTHHDTPAATEAIGQKAFSA